MPFDLNTAKPIEPAASGFDLASAKPVDDEYSHEGRPRPAARKKGYRPTSEAETFGEAGEAAGGAVETAGSLISGIPATIIGGLAGAGKAVYRGLKGDSASEALAAGGGTARHVQEALTYEPRTGAGKNVSGMAALPIEVANDLLGRGGEIVGEAAGDAAAGRTIGENAIPAALAVAGARNLARNPVAKEPPVAGRDYTPLRQMSMEEEARYRRQKGQGVQPTLGSVTRDPAQVRFEQQTAATEAGAPLHQRATENDAALVNVAKGIKEQPGPVGPNIKGSRDQSAADTGRAMRRSVEAKKAAKDQEVNEAYDKARASGETKELVDMDPIKRFLSDHEAEAAAVPELNSVARMVSILEDKAKKGEHPGMASIDDLELIRQRIGVLAQRDGSVKAYMGKLREGIDQMTEGKGGDLYKDARAKRRAVGKEFEDQAGVANVIDKKSATDYKVAGEDVWHKTVVNGSTEDMANVIKTLRTSGEKQKPEALQTLKDMQARAIDMVLEEGTKTGPVSKAGLQRGIKAIGQEKLELLIGKEAVQKLHDMVTTTGDLKTPPVRVPGSDTSVNLRVEAERAAVDHGVKLMKGVLPGPLRYVAKGVEMLREGSARQAERRRLAGQVDEALTPTRASPTTIREEAATQTRERRKYLMHDAARKMALPAAATMADRESDE